MVIVPQSRSGGIRTHTGITPADFKSAASAIPPPTRQAHSREYLPPVSTESGCQRSVPSCRTLSTFSRLVWPTLLYKIGVEHGQHLFDHDSVDCFAQRNTGTGRWCPRPGKVIGSNSAGRFAHALRMSWQRHAHRCRHLSRRSRRNRDAQGRALLGRSLRLDSLSGRGQTFIQIGIVRAVDSLVLLQKTGVFHHCPLCGWYPIAYCTVASISSNMLLFSRLCKTPAMVGRSSARTALFLRGCQYQGLVQLKRFSPFWSCHLVDRQDSSGKRIQLPYDKFIGSRRHSRQLVRRRKKKSLQARPHEAARPEMASGQS